MQPEEQMDYISQEIQEMFDELEGNISYNDLRGGNGMYDRGGIYQELRRIRKRNTSLREAKEYVKYILGNGLSILNTASLGEVHQHTVYNWIKRYGFYRKDRWKYDGRTKRCGIKIFAHDKHSKWRQKNMALGLCYRCGKPPNNDLRLCDRCREYKNRKRRKLR